MGGVVMLQTILVLLIIVAAFALTMVILKVQERHIREDGANYEEYVYKRDLRKNKNEQIAAIVLFIIACVATIAISMIVAINA
jgi:hypothetical protein